MITLYVHVVVHVFMSVVTSPQHAVGYVLVLLRVVFGVTCAKEVVSLQTDTIFQASTLYYAFHFILIALLISSLNVLLCLQILKYAITIMEVNF